MATHEASSGVAAPVDETLRKVVVTYRLLTLVWVWILISVTIFTEGPGNRVVLFATMALTAVWSGVTIWAGRSSKRLGSLAFVVLDGLVAGVVFAAGYIAGTDDFVSGGWPGSWLFTVAFAFNIRWTIGASLLLLIEHVVLHERSGFETSRIVGGFLFIAVAVIIGWAFDALRERERIRLALEDELRVEREALEVERESIARHEERAVLARHLHDEVLQTLHAIDVAADNSSQVRYLVRRQTRELRRTIEEFRSPFHNSFRASLLRGRDEVEDLHRGVQINEVIRSDAEVTPALAAAIQAAREAMMNAAKHSGVVQVDLYSEIEDGFAIINIRDRGVGFGATDPSTGGLLFLHEGVAQVGGEVEIRSHPDQGTQVTIKVQA